MSDAFEGSISDKDSIITSGFLDFLENGDIIMADRGFVIVERAIERRIKKFRVLQKAIPLSLEPVFFSTIICCMSLDRFQDPFVK